MADIIDELVSKQALDQLSMLNTELGTCYDTFGKLLQEVDKASSEFKKAGVSFMELSKVIERVESVEKELYKTQERQTRIRSEAEGIRTREIKSTSEQVKAIENLRNAYNGSAKAIENQMRAVNDGSDAFRKAKESITEQAKSLTLLKGVLSGTQQEMRNLDKQYKSGNLSVDDYLSKKGELIKQEQQYKLEVRDSQSSLKYNVQVINSNIESYNRLSAQYGKMKVEINSMSEAEIRNGKTKDTLQKEAEELYAQMIRLQEATGKHTLSVGNYAKGWNGLNNQVNQLVRELPSLTQGANMFFLAISNNLPLFVDELQKAKRETAELKAQGAAVVPVWKQVIQGFLSWQTLVVIGITLLTRYGKEIIGFIGNLFKANRALNETVNVEKEVIKSMKDGSGEIGKQIVQLKNMQSEWNKLGGDLDKKKKYVTDNKDEFEKLGVSVGNVTDAENVLVGNTDAVIESLKQKAMAAAAMELATKKYKEAIEKQIEAEERALNPSDSDVAKATMRVQQQNATGIYLGTASADEVNKEAARIAKEASDSLLQEANSAFKTGDAYLYYKQKKKESANQTLLNAGITPFSGNETKEKEDKALKDLQRMREKFLEEERKLIEENKIFAIGMKADELKQIISEEQNAYGERISALNEYSSQLASLIEASRLNQIAEVQREMKELGLTEEQGKQHILEINQKAQSELIKLDNETYKLRLDIAKDNEKKLIEIIKNRTSEIESGGDAGTQNALVSLAENYAKEMELYENNADIREKIEKKYQRDRLDTIMNYSQQSYDAQIGYLKEELLKYSENEEVKASILEKIKELENEKAKEIADYKIEQAERSADEQMSIEDKLKKFLDSQYSKTAQAAWGIAFDTMTMYYDEQLNRIDELEKRENEYWDDKLKVIEENVEAGLMSEEEADARRRIIEETQLQREKDFEAQRKEMQKKQAVWQKANAIMQATMNTAMAFTSALGLFPPPLGIAMAAIVGAMGAAQIAMIASQSIPSYAKGTESHPGGLAVVGDGGRPEMVLTPSGQVWKTPARDTLAYLPKGAEVLPDFRDAFTNMFAAPRIDRAYNDDKGEMFAFDDVLRSNTKKTNDNLAAINSGIRAIRANSRYSDKKSYLMYKFNKRYGIV